METLNNNKLLETYLEQGGITKLFNRCRPRFYLLHYLPGDLITSPFSPTPFFHFLVDGEILLYDMPDESTVNTVVTAYNWVRTLGDIELFDAGFTPLFVEAKTDVLSVAFYLDQNREILLNEPAFLRYLCTGFAQKLKGATVDSSSVSLRNRIRSSLSLMEPGQTISGVAHIAKSLNVSNRQLLRVLKEFCDAGILEHEKKGVYRLMRKP